MGSEIFVELVIMRACDLIKLLERGGGDGGFVSVRPVRLCAIT